MESENSNASGTPPEGVPEKKHDTVTGFAAAAKASAEEGLIPKWLIPFIKWFRIEWAGVKAGRKLFIILAVIVLGAGALAMHKWDGTKIQSLKSNYALSNSFLLGKIEQNKEDKRTSELIIQDLKADIGKLTTEKASAESRAQISAALLLQIPSITTNLLSLALRQQKRWVSSGSGSLPKL